MLQTGKKAEIEVLSTATEAAVSNTSTFTTSSPNPPVKFNINAQALNSFPCSASMSSASAFSMAKAASQDHQYVPKAKTPAPQMVILARTTSPLLRYLRSEITTAVLRATEHSLER
jgi:hypothetical protein